MLLVTLSCHIDCDAVRIDYATGKEIARCSNNYTFPHGLSEENSRTVAERMGWHFWTSSTGEKATCKSCSFVLRARNASMGLPMNAWDVQPSRT